MDAFFQNLLAGKKVLVETQTESAKTEETEILEEKTEENIESLDKHIRKYLGQYLVGCSNYMRQEEDVYQKVRKYFSIPDWETFYCFWDYTLFGNCKEGVAVCSSGVYFRTISRKVTLMKWSELSEYDIHLDGTGIQFKAKNQKNSGMRMSFLKDSDAEKFFKVLEAMKQL